MLIKLISASVHLFRRVRGSHDTPIDTILTHSGPPDRSHVYARLPYLEFFWIV